MNETPKLKLFDLEERTFNFAMSCKDLIKKLPRNINNIEYVKQLVRSSSSIAANYIEANESLSKKDFFYRVKICKKESKESGLWLKLIDIQDNLSNNQKDLIRETIELCKIFGAILEKQK